MTFPDRKLWLGHDPIALYEKVMDALKGDPIPLLTACQSEDEETRDEARATLVERLKGIFPQQTEQRYLEFMDYVKALTTEYRPLSDIGYQPTSYRDVCGLWFNRRRASYRQLWATWRALYIHQHGLPLPKECYDAIGSSASESLDWAFTEQTDQVDRQGINNGWTGLLNG